jgi:hypothetical protein
MVGNNTTIGDDTVVSASTIGRLCIIGKNVQISGSYVWDGAIIEDNVILRNCIICDSARVRRDARVLEGAVVSYRVRECILTRSVVIIILSIIVIFLIVIIATYMHACVHHLSFNFCLLMLVRSCRSSSALVSLSRQTPRSLWPSAVSGTSSMVTMMTKASSSPVQTIPIP